MTKEKTKKTLPVTIIFDGIDITGYLVRRSVSRRVSYVIYETLLDVFLDYPLSSYSVKFVDSIREQDIMTLVLW